MGAKLLFAKIFGSSHLNEGRAPVFPLGVPQTALVHTMNLDPSTVSRRVEKAVELGYLKDLNADLGIRKMKLVVDRPMPRDTGAIPHPDDVEYGDGPVVAA
jgi:DNA-binding Lrp family transcriptional regulator